MPTSKRKRRHGGRLRTGRLVHPKGEHAPEPSAEAEETLRRFYDSASVMMGTVELSENDILHVSDNRATATFFDTTLEAMQGRSAREMGVPEAYISMWLDAYRASTTSDGPVRFDYEHEGKGWLKVTVNYISQIDGRQRFLYVVDDISDRKRTEQALQEAHDQLEARVEARTVQVRALAADLTLAEQRERGRITQLLHDELQQQLFALQMIVKNMLSRAATLEAHLMVDELTEAYSLTKASMATTRTLISELSSTVLQGGDLTKALEWLAEHVQGRYALKVTVVAIEQVPELPKALTVLLFQCVQELLFNVVKHARAEHAYVSLQTSAEGLKLEVKDNGRGFVVRPSESEAPMQSGFGLRSVEQRLEVFSGVVQIDSVPGNGTLVAIKVPLD